jgi:hypothetical protein
LAASNNGYSGQGAYGEKMGANSSCFASTLVQTGSGYAAPGAACFPARCAAGPALVVSVGSASVTCAASGQQLAVPGFAGALTCPDLALACATPFDPPIVPNATDATALATPSPSAHAPIGPGGGGGGGGSSSSTSATSSLFGLAAGVGLGVIVLISAACYFFVKPARPPPQLAAAAPPPALPMLPVAVPYAHQLPQQGAYA